MKFKKFLLPILILAVVLTAMAFTIPGNSKKLTAPKTKKADTEYSYDFKYIGPESAYSITEYLDPDNYVLFSGLPYEECEYGNDEVCIISCVRYWNGVEWKPNFYYDQSYGSAYWGLNNFINYGYSGTFAVIMKDLP